MKVGSTVTGWGPCRWTVVHLYDEATSWPDVECFVCDGEAYGGKVECSRCDYGSIPVQGPGRLMAHIECDTHPTATEDWRNGHGPVAVYADQLTEVTAPAEHYALPETEEAALW